MTKIVASVQSRYGWETGFVSAQEARSWAERQSGLLQGKFNVFDGDRLIAIYQNGVDAWGGPPLVYRIKKGVRPHGGKRFRADPPLTPDATRLVGQVLTTYKELGPYSYARTELELEEAR